MRFTQHIAAAAGLACLPAVCLGSGFRDDFQGVCPSTRSSPHTAYRLRGLQ
jgi:hypothetical protein